MIIQKTENSRISTFDPNNFSFGGTFSDHMIICEYENGKWGEVKLVPYGPLLFTPAMMGVNYGQACFEGMKAYKDKDGQVFLFRPERILSVSINLQLVWQCHRLQKKSF